MNNIKKFITTWTLFLLCAFIFTSCIEEVEPTSYATEKQVSKSSAATDALLSAMTSQQNTIWSGDVGYGWGLGSILKIRDVCTGDVANQESNYDHYTQWSQNYYISEEYLATQFVWQFYFQLVLTTNNLISAIDPESATEKNLAALGCAYAFRAMWYLDMARMYEFLPNDIYTDGKNLQGNDVSGLTIPIVKDGMTKEEARNNPRATRQEMFDFILSDLDKAQEYTKYVTDTRGQILPDSSVVLGLKAHLYMWVEDYPKAEEFARRAIDAFGKTPMTKDECLNITTGFNTADPWMLASQQIAESETVMSALLNWTSWMSNQTTYGYTSLQGDPFVMIDHKMYDRISNNDFRKLWFKAPANSSLANQVSYVHTQFKQLIPTYGSVKFRPGDANYGEYSIGSATAYPLMRVEEMYFIEAEAAAHQDAARGKKLVTDFMKTYRNASYSTSVSSTDDVVEEIVFQKRVELWGEGQTFFDIKRLNYSVTRGYDGTNFAPLTRFNTNGRPSWMNFCIVRSEAQNNTALKDMNNPDPSDTYKPWQDPNE